MSKTNIRKSTIGQASSDAQRLQELIEGKERTNRAKSYSEYLSTLSDDPADEYGEARRSAELLRMASSPGYGTQGEALGRTGLSRSGYAAYLGDAGERSFRRASSKAEDALTKENEERRRSYDQYLDRYGEEQSELLREAIRRMSSGGFEGYDDGYRYAVTRGLAGEGAELFARMCDAYGSAGKRGIASETRIELLREIMRNGLDYESAYLYARAVGASTDTAEKIAAFASSAANDLGGLLGDGK